MPRRLRCAWADGGRPAQNPGHHTAPGRVPQGLSRSRDAVSPTYHRAPMSPIPTPPRLVIFDLDGVIYRGPDAVPGAVSLVAHLHDAGIGVRFATNNSMVARTGYVERLGSPGI